MVQAVENAAVCKAEESDTSVPEKIRNENP
jgi:hypothetical protein